ncbi:MAG: histidine phosphotransferase family protein [Rhizomicrobium sp.]
MNELELSALMVSRVCHDLVGPLGAVVNGLEVLEDERDAKMREDALRLVATSAGQALARIQFMRIAFGAAGSAGAELDLGEIGRLVGGVIEGGRVRLEWSVPHAYWPKDRAKLLMNVALLGAESLPRGGLVKVLVEAGSKTFHVHAAGQVARLAQETLGALKGEALSAPLDARFIHPYLTYCLARGVGTDLAVTAGDGFVEFTAG